MRLAEEDRLALITALSKWAETHPRANDPVISAGSHLLSPKTYLSEVQRGTPLGNTLLDIMGLFFASDKMDPEIYVRAYWGNIGL